MIIKMTSEAKRILLLRKAGFDIAHIAKEISASEAHVGFIIEQLNTYSFT